MTARIHTLHPFLNVAGLPEHARPLMSRLLSEPIVPIASLLRGIATYRLVIEAAAARNGRANVGLGHRIANALMALLARVDDRVGKNERLVIQAAVRYFVIEDDGFGNDLEDEDGLFNDARVVNAMLRWFGRDDLCVALRTPTLRRVGGHRAAVG